ncbi:MAG: serine O-acetyltransferase [Psychroserpens sp.]|jgi:serine O-acetyltransferase
MLTKNKFELIKSDLFRYAGKTSFNIFIKYYFTNCYFRFQVYLRLSNLNVLFIAYIFRFMKARLGKKVNIQLSRKVPIGLGLYIPHGNIVVNSKTIIGHNCSLLQFSSIGAMHNGKAAEIGDNVYIGPNSNIVGAIHIGSNSVLGAGAVVVKDIENCSVVVGSPGKAIKKVENINHYCENLFPLNNTNE